MSIACMPSSFFNIPWLIGILTILYYALASVVLTELFELRSPVTVALLSALLISFPSVASIFSYMYTADGYAMALLFAVLAVFFTKKYRFGFIGGGVFLSLSLGIYQAYLSFALMLVLFLLAIKLFDEATKAKSLFAYMGRFVLMVVIGFVLYYVILQIALSVQGGALSGYQGVDVLVNPAFSPALLFSGIKAAYIDFINFFAVESPYSGTMSRLIIIVYILFCAALLINQIIIRKLYKSVWRLCMLFAAAALIPVVLNIILLINPVGTSYHMLMRSSYTLLFAAGIIFCENLLSKRSRGQILKWVSVITLAIFCIQGVLISNIGYYNMQQRYEKEYALCIRMVDRIEQIPEFSPDTPVAFIGMPPSQLSWYENETQDYLRGMIGMTGNSFLPSDFHYKQFMIYYLNVDFASPSSELLQKIADSDEFYALGVWPQTECIGYISGVLVIRLS